MPLPAPLDFQRWIDEHRHLLKPPVANKCVYDGEYVIRDKATGRKAHAEVFVSTDRSRSADFLEALRKNGESVDGVGDEAAIDFLNASTQGLMRLDDTYILVAFRDESQSDTKLTTKRILQAIAKKLG